jgi:hypothetical protein
MSITSANAQLAISVANLYPTPQSIQGFASDDSFTVDAQVLAENVMGVDGRLSSGFVFNPISQTIMIMADSPSLPVFENWANAQRAAREIYKANATIKMPGIRRKYTLINGTLTSVPPMAGVKKTLQSLSYSIVWESVVGEAY